MMKKVIIVCAGNRAREIRANIYRINAIADEKGEERPYKLLGFINDVPDALKGSGITEPVMGSIVDWYPIDDEFYIMGTADPYGKEKIAKMLIERGCKFTSLISPNAIIPSGIKMGEGCIVEAYRIGYGVELGDFVSVNGSMIMSGARIGSFSTTTGFTVVENAIVGERTLIGSHAVICDGVHVGNDVKINIGSIVIKDVPDGATVFGVPAEETGW